MSCKGGCQPQVQIVNEVRARDNGRQSIRYRCRLLSRARLYVFLTLELTRVCQNSCGAYSSAWDKPLNTVPGAIATAYNQRIHLVQISTSTLNLFLCWRILSTKPRASIECGVATATPAGRPGWGPWSAPGTVIECQREVSYRRQTEY